MPKPSDEQRQALAGLLGLGTHSARKSHYPELQARLEELEAERNRYKWLFEHAVHGIFQAGLQGGIRAANPALLRMLGYDSIEQAMRELGRRSHNLFVGGDAELAGIRRTLSRERGLFGYETRLCRQDGSAIDVMMNLLLKPGDEELVEGFVADITERKQAQQHLLQLNEQLELRVAERTRELREARDAAEAANLSKDKYLAAASHDLLQPLNAARLLISTLRERHLPEAEQTLVERAHQALEGAEDLLTDLLDISKLDQSAVKPDIHDYRLDEIFRPLLSEFQPVAQAAGLALECYIPAYTIRGDFRLLTRILRNFLSNACRYTDQGRVLLGARKRNGHVRLEVWDTGRGIEPDQIQSIFLEFNQLGVQRTVERAGVGLGLAIVERIANMLDYRIEVLSQAGRGSMFSVHVPPGQPAHDPHGGFPALLPMLGDPLPGCRLLVIDNELSILLSMRALLEQWGCQVLTAADRQQAFAVLDGQAPDLILADYHLDLGGTGWDVAQGVREHFARPIPVVMITADRSDQCRRQLQGLNVPVLNKPVKAGKMRAVLGHLLQRREGLAESGQGGVS